MTPTETLPAFSDFPAATAAPALWFFFGIVMLLTLYYAFAQLYHWLRYAYMYPLVWIALPVYFIGIIVLIGAMLSGIGSI